VALVEARQSLTNPVHRGGGAMFRLHSRQRKSATVPTRFIVPTASIRRIQGCSGRQFKGRGGLGRGKIDVAVWRLPFSGRYNRRPGCMSSALSKEFTCAFTDSVAQAYINVAASAGRCGLIAVIGPSGKYGSPFIYATLLGNERIMKSVEAAGNGGRFCYVDGNKRAREPPNLKSP